MTRYDLSTELWRQEWMHGSISGKGWCMASWVALVD